MSSVPTRCRLTFDVSPTTTAGPGGPLVVSPRVDGEKLAALVERFEKDHEFSPAGGYDGLVLDDSRMDDPLPHFLGRADNQRPGPGLVWLLGCDCGQVECWPLEARIIALQDTVTRTDFAQPHRPERNYDGFGPFVFDRRQYERAVAWVSGELNAG